MPTLTEAVDFLQSGDWPAAHMIAQEDDSTLGSWAHGIVHLQEGDLDNAAYWFRKAERPVPDPESIPQEIAALRAALELRKK